MCGFYIIQPIPCCVHGIQLTPCCVHGIQLTPCCVHGIQLARCIFVTVLWFSYNSADTGSLVIQPIPCCVQSCGFHIIQPIQCCVHGIQLTPCCVHGIQLARCIFVTVLWFLYNVHGIQLKVHFCDSLVVFI